MTELVNVQSEVPQLALGLGEMERVAEKLVASRFLPEAIKTKEQALAVMLKGRELGIPPMQAFSHIHVIQGKPTISPELMMALIYRKYPSANVQFTKLERNGCEIMAARPGMQPVKIGFDEEDAKAAGLLSKSNWKTYPRAMYRSRAVAEMARSIFPDAISGGSYTPEELGADVAFSDSGEIVNVTPPAAQPAPKAATGYTGTPDQQAYVQRILEEQGIDESVWEDVHKALMGKPSAELNNVIAKVIGK